MIKAISKELIQRVDYTSEEIQTIYFGGGTPSLLSGDQLTQLLDAISKNFKVAPEVEVTLEANPEDLASEYLTELKQIGINRLSIGVQTFSEEKLKWMNRAHSVEDVRKGYHASREVGFENISIDLIYALPDRDLEGWKFDLQKAMELQPEHISLYGLTIEPKTVFGKRKTRGEFTETPEQAAANQYLTSIELLAEGGYLQYEVANFSLSGYTSRHNASYWAGRPYLGVGPGAHSYEGTSRQFNIRNNAKYLAGIVNGESYYEMEKLSKTQLMNETILTRLRTMDGLDLKEFHSDFGLDLSTHYKEELDALVTDGLLTKNHCVSLTSKGFLLADEIALKLFFEE